MTTPQPVQALLAAPRRLAAWALIGYSGLHLALVFLRWIAPADVGTFGARSAAAASGFTALVELALPLLAVLLVTSGSAEDASDSARLQAKLIATVALIEYAAILFFGTVTYLIGLGAEFAPREGLAVLSYLLLTLGRLGLALGAGLVTYQAWVRLGGSFAALSRPNTPAPPTGPTPPTA